MMKRTSIFWFRRDLRLEDNHGLFQALKSGNPVLCLFILDEEILADLRKDDPRVGFILRSLEGLRKKLEKFQSTILVQRGEPLTIWKRLISEFEIAEVFANHDYEPYALGRDRAVADFLKSQGIPFRTFKDQVIFEKDEVLKDDGKPYTVFTPYSRKWLARLRPEAIREFNTADLMSNLFKHEDSGTIEPERYGLEPGSINVADPDLSIDTLEGYAKSRDVPSKDSTTRLGPHLRFGTISIRKLVATFQETSSGLLNELIWREFFMQILYHFPRVVTKSFKPQYDKVKWQNSKELFELWCLGKTGYPLVDAGMRELNETGFMHNRVRMITASFLCKHLLIDWRWGEAYFAERLLDYELSSNNGNWQWAAGSGCDAAPYFRVFNPTAQQEKFDPDHQYIRKWVREFGSDQYPQPIVDHKFARQRAIDTYKQALQ